MSYSVLAAVLIAGAPAAAQDDERARLHFESGRSYFAEGAYERALQEFQQAYTLSERPALLFNIGQTEERLAMYEEAAQTFERYLAAVPNDENRAVLERRIANLRERAQGRATQPHTEPLPEPQATTGPRTATQTPSTSGGNDGLVLGGIAALAVGGAALVTWAILGGLALGEQSEIENGCYPTRSCTPADVADMDAFALGADIMWPVGAVAAGVGVALLIVGLTSSSSEHASIELLPYADANGAGAVLRGAL
jgi:tetratricopeptide (TPR) repeat protein